MATIPQAPPWLNISFDPADRLAQVGICGLMRPTTLKSSYVDLGLEALNAGDFWTVWLITQLIEERGLGNA